jgi:homoserine dehydrogenase
LLGYGRVGQAVAALALRERDRLNALGFDVSVTTALARDPEKPRPGDGIRTLFDSGLFFKQPFNVVVDVMGGVEPAFTLVRRALETGVPVVSANKTLIARRGEELVNLSRCHGVPLAFDAAVLAGVPFLGALARLPSSAPHGASPASSMAPRIFFCPQSLMARRLTMPSPMRARADTPSRTAAPTSADAMRSRS